MPSLRCPVRGTWSLSEASAGEAKKQVGVKGEGAAFPLKRAKGEVFAPPMEERHQPRPPFDCPFHPVRQEGKRPHDSRRSATVRECDGWE